MSAGDRYTVCCPHSASVHEVLDEATATLIYIDPTSLRGRCLVEGCGCLKHETAGKSLQAAVRIPGSAAAERLEEQRRQARAMAEEYSRRAAAFAKVEREAALFAALGAAEVLAAAEDKTPKEGSAEGGAGTAPAASPPPPFLSPKFFSSLRERWRAADQVTVAAAALFTIAVLLRIAGFLL